MDGRNEMISIKDILWSIEFAKHFYEKHGDETDEEFEEWLNR